MPIFGKKREDKKKRIGKGFIPIDKVKELVSSNVPEGEIIEALRREGFSAEETDKAFIGALKPVSEVQTPKPKKVKKPEFAPLFVKLERYKQILSDLEGLRTTMAAIKNAFSILNQLDKLRYENIGMLQNTIEKVDEKLAALDSEFLRPAGFREELPTEEYSEGLESELGNLKNQVDKLKSELKSVA